MAARVQTPWLILRIGNDTYVVDNAGDLVAEGADEAPTR